MSYKIIYAELASDVYRENLRVGDQVNGWEVALVSKQSLTGYQGALYKNINSGEFVFASRGTEIRFDPEVIMDLTSDIQMGVGKIPLQYAAQRGFFDEASRYFAANMISAANVTLVGHSLGGALIGMLGADHPEYQAVTFNAYGPGLLRGSRGMLFDDDFNNITNHVIDGDPVSVAFGSKFIGKTFIYDDPNPVASGNPIASAFAFLVTLINYPAVLAWSFYGDTNVAENINSLQDAVLKYADFLNDHSVDNFTTSSVANSAGRPITIKTFSDEQIRKIQDSISGNTDELFSNGGNKAADIWSRIVDDIFKIIGKTPPSNGISKMGDAEDNLINGGPGDDTLSGEAGGDVVYGQGGNDEIDGGAGDDIIDGGDGDDTIGGGAGIDMLLGGLGRDKLSGGSETDLIRGGDGGDTISGGGEDDSLYGEADDDELNGDDGDDGLDGGDGNDTLNGGIGTDLLEGGEGGDHLFGDAGKDTLRGDAGNDKLNGGLGDDLLQGGAGEDTLFGVFGNDSLYGEDGNDQLFGDEDKDYMSGGIGNDTLYGGDGEDAMYGDDGDDLMYGGNQNDTMIGGVGSDSILGDDGNDFLNGDAGFDTLYGGNGNDTLYGAIGNDNLHGDIGDDYIRGEEGEDALYGEEGDDRLDGGGGSDKIYGGIGKDTLSGGLGNDTLNGGAGDDHIYGDDGADELNDDSGVNILDGGIGDDIITGSGTLVGGEGNDTLIGGATGNSYIFNRGDGFDAINDQGGIDDLTLGFGHSDLWFRRTGSGLEISFDKENVLVINNWYSGENGLIEQMSAGGKKLMAANVESLVAAMAAFSPPSAGQATLTPEQNENINLVIAANWK